MGEGGLDLFRLNRVRFTLVGALVYFATGEGSSLGFICQVSTSPEGGSVLSWAPRGWKKGARDNLADHPYLYDIFADNNCISYLEWL